MRLHLDDLLGGLITGPSHAIQFGIPVQVYDHNPPKAIRVLPARAGWRPAATAIVSTGRHRPRTAPVDGCRRAKAMDAGDLQRAHYERIHDAYTAHYYDATAIRYRERFIYDWLFDGLDLDGRSVADLASGSGHNSLALLRRFPRAEVTGFDVSPSACRDYTRLTGRPSVECDLTQPMDVPAPFDCALVVGGLHHCVADLATALANVERLVRPGGTFLLVEPNAACFLEGLRRLWYRADPHFQAETERALTHEELAALAPGFAPARVRYFGGPGYFLLCNSLVMRVPLALKPVIERPLAGLEAAYNALPGRRPFPAFMARWRRREEDPHGSAGVRPTGFGPRLPRTGERPAVSRRTFSGLYPETFMGGPAF